MKELINIHQLRPRYAETDQMGVIYNTNYFIYFETGRSELMRRYGIRLRSYEENDNVFFPLLDSYAKFHSPARYDELLTIETKLLFTDALSYRFEYRIFREETLLVSGYTTHCFVKRDTLKPCRPPKCFMEILNEV